MKVILIFVILIIRIKRSLEIVLEKSISNFLDDLILATLPDESSKRSYVNFPMCRMKVLEMDENPETVLNLFFFSSKDFNRPGDIDSCLMENKLYLTMKFFYYYPRNSTKLNKRKTGSFCFYKECEHVFKLIIDEDNKNLKAYFEELHNVAIDIESVRFLGVDDGGGRKFSLINKEEGIPISGAPSRIFALKIILIILSIYLGFRIFIQVFNKHVIKNRVLLKLLTKTIKFLHKHKNTLYNESNLNSFGLLMALSLFGINYNILITSYIFASDKSTSDNSRKSILKIFDRLSCHCYVLYIMLRGLFFSYKLFHYLEDTEKTLKDFLKFYCKNLVNLFCFFLFFLFYNYFYRELYYMLAIRGNPTPKNLQFLSWNICFEDNILYYFIPFYFNILNYERNKANSFTFYIKRHPCNNDYLLLSCEFYMFNLYLFVFYLCYKMRSKFFEIGVIICSLLFTIGMIMLDPYIYLNNWIIHKNFSLKFEIQFQNFAGPYFLGILAGVLFYYHKNIMLFVPYGESLNDTNKCLSIRKFRVTHFPFHFLLGLNRFFHRFSDKWIGIWSVFSLLLVLLNSSIVVFDYENSLIVYYTDLKESYIYLQFFYFLVDGHIFSLIVFFYLLVKFYEDYTPVWKYFIILNRCGLSFLLNSIFVSSLIYLYYEYTKVNMLYLNAILSVGGFICTLFMGLSFQILFMIPIKFFWKRICYLYFDI